MVEAVPSDESFVYLIIISLFPSIVHLKKRIWRKTENIGENKEVRLLYILN